MNRMPIFTLALLASALAYAVFESGGVVRADWNVSLALIGAGVLLYWVRVRPSDLAPPLEPGLRWPLLLLPAYVLLQLAPLPVALLRLLSPARAELAAATASVLPPAGLAPLSVNPPATLEHLLRLCAYVAAFLLVRELAWRLDRRPWLPILPLAGIAAAEAVLGIAGSHTTGFAHGTYVNRNHFAGLLELALPFAAAYAIAALCRGRGPLSLRRAMAACLGLGAASLMFVAVLLSVSRTGFLASIAGLLVVAVCGIAARRWLLFGGALAAAILVALLWLPPDALMDRLTSLSAPGEISTDTRLAIWADTLRLVKAYPVFGAGAGAYESALYRYKTAAPLNTVDYAHNDYLQLLAELGAVGVILLAVAWFALVRKLVRDIRTLDGRSRYVSVASLGALAAISLHSLADFNLYIPANALALAWIAGVAAAGRVATPAPDRAWKAVGFRPAVEVKAAK